ncbi:MAG: hypothetical protein QXN77_07300 [Candidatus Caldarchaeum sp.]
MLLFHVLEDLASIGVRAESYDSYAGYEHHYARLLNSHDLDVDLIVFPKREWCLKNETCLGS